MPQLPGRKIAFLMATMNETVYTAEDRFSIAQGLYWYCADYHAGQNSPEYAVLSTLGYRPGACERGPDPDDSTAQAVRRPGIRAT